MRPRSWSSVVWIGAVLLLVPTCKQPNAAPDPAQQGSGGEGDTTAGIGTGADTSTSPPPGTVADTVGQVNVDSFFTQSLGVTKRYLVYLPPSYATSGTRRYPVAYFLHGTEATERSWVNDMHLDHTLDSLAKLKGADKPPEMIVVMPDGDDAFYHTWAVDPNYTSCLARGSVNGQPATTYCVPHMRYDEYLAHDLVGHIDSLYRTKADGQHRGIAGLSMGGMGAIALTFRYPTVFGAAASLSGAILSLLNVGGGQQATAVEQLHTYYDANHGTMWTEYQFPDQFGSNLDTWRKYDPLSLASHMVTAHQSFPPLWLMVGKDDGEALVENRVFDQALTQWQVGHTYSEQPGAHNVAFWTAHAGEASAWLAKQIGL